MTLSSWKGDQGFLALRCSCIADFSGLTTQRLEACEKYEHPTFLPVEYGTLYLHACESDLYLCVQVIACHDYREGDEMKSCSNRAIVSARTLPDSES